MNLTLLTGWPLSVMMLVLWGWWMVLTSCSVWRRMERGSGRLFSASRLSNNNKNTAASATQSYKSVSVPHLQKAKPQKSSRFAPLWPFFGPKLPQCHRTITEWRYKNFDRNRYRDLFSDTKFSETETFVPIPNFLKPEPRLFSDTKFFQDRNQYFFSKTKFSETETVTFFRDKFFPKPRLFFRDHIFWNRNPQDLNKTSQHLLKWNSENLGLISKIGMFGKTNNDKHN